jgi:molybdopterin-guanine dinucleotide biosynthesis protein A
MPDSVAGFILAGGRSRRMGSDKSRLQINGVTLVERIAGELQKITGSITLVGGQAVAGLNHTPDLFPDLGALGGVHAALANCHAPAALVVACDFPFVTAELFQHLCSFRHGHDAVAPIQEDGIPQPLCAVYNVDPCLEIAEQMIKTGERKPVALLQSVRTRWMPFSELSNLNAAKHFFDNVNTPEDYIRASAHACPEDRIEDGDPTKIR